MTVSEQTTVGILIFDGVEVLDFCGPFEVFSVARARTADGEWGEQAPFRTLTIAARAGIVRCVGDLLVQPHNTIEDHPPLDVLVVPGGRGTRREQTNIPLLAWIAAQNRRTALTTSVCTGAFLLAANRLLDGLRATTHWASIDRLREQYPAIDVRADERVVDEGRIVTSAGISAGIDMALHLVARLKGEEIAVDAARLMEYEWRRPGAVALGPADEAGKCVSPAFSSQPGNEEAEPGGGIEVIPGRRRAVG